MSDERDQSKSTIKSRTNRRLGKCLNKSFVGIGLIFLVCAVPYAALQLVRCPRLPQNLAYTYIALAIIPLALGVFLCGAFPHWKKKRRTIEPAELEGLYSEINRYRSSDGKDQLRIEAVKHAEREKTKLESLDRPVLELDALPLRQALVDLYHPAAELIAKTRGELEYLEVYTSIEDADRVNGIINDLEKSIKDGSTEEKEKQKRVELERRLRADLKSLRDTSAWYDRTWAIGEWLRVCVTCWACATVLVTMLVGIMPIIHSQGSWNLCIVHWAVLGTTGALLSILIKLDKLDVSEVGETLGKELLQGTIRSIGIGALTAVLLYSAIWGGALEGVIFPVLPISKAQSEISKVKVSSDGGEKKGYETKNQVGVDTSKETVVNEIALDEADTRIDKGLIKDIGLSIFWAIFAGLSPVVLRRMSQVAEGSLGELKSEGDEE